MRMTRAALRAQNPEEIQSIHEDAEAADVQELELDQNSQRPALKDITEENYPGAESMSSEQTQLAGKKPKGRGKGRSAKKTKGVEQQSEPERNSGAEEAQEEVHHSQNSSEMEAIPIPEPETLQAAPCSPKREFGVALITPSKEPTIVSKTPKFDPEKHATPRNGTDSTYTANEDSFIGSIRARAPRMDASIEGIQSPDSLTGNVHSRSPAIHSPRIEDSVDAIDALEEALEKLTETLPTMERLTLDSPELINNDHQAGPTKNDTPLVLRTPLNSTNKPKTTKASNAKVQVTRPTVSKPVVAPKPKPTVNMAKTRPATTTIKPKPVTKTVVPEKRELLSKPGLSFSSSPTKQNPEAKKRVPSSSLSTTKPGFVPAKSSKPPTKSTFVLPGEAISAKLKAQREERLKREEEAEKARRSFKARPTPSSISRPSVMPRENKTSQARLSVFGGSSDKENVSPKPNATYRHSVDLSRIEPPKSNTSIRRTASVKSTAPAPRVTSLSAGQKSIVTKEDANQQKIRGKEVFSRSRTEMDRIEKEKKEKEEAAKKARAEAAERGRQASREWAEKQKKRLALQEAKMKAEVPSS